MTTVIGVRFKKTGKLYYFDPHDKQVTAGERVIVETSRGVECGQAVFGNMEVDSEEIVQPLRRLIRIATEADQQVIKENEARAKEAFAICREKIEHHKLDMHLVDVECTFDMNKILFYFTADGRVDFRDLVKDLAGVFHTRIELRQIGVRDEAKMIGGLGACGRELCCSSYMEEFQPVSINMAKDQNLSLNPTKISGTCGRLMCCLKYEHEVYSELQRKTPKQGSYVETPDGNGTVVSVQMLRGICKVQIEGSSDAPKEYACQDCRVLRSAKGKSGRNAVQAAQNQVETAKQEEKNARFQQRQDRDKARKTAKGEEEHARKVHHGSNEKPHKVSAAEENFGNPSEGAEVPRKRSHRGGRRRSSGRNKQNSSNGATTSEQHE